MPEAAGMDLSIREWPPSAKVRVLTWHADFLPETAAALRSLAGVTVLRTAPSDWCLVSEVGRESIDGAALLRAAGAAVAADPGARVVDVSHALCAIAVTGTRARELLEKGCSLDLHPRVFAIGDSTRTRFANVAAIVLREGNDAFRCYVARSHRDYVLSWLNDAAAEWPGA